MKTNPGKFAIEFFNQLTIDNIDEVDNVYAENIEFRDPVTVIKSRSKLKAYIRAQYKNVVSCQFEAGEIITEDRTSAVKWTMRLRHKYLKFGQIVELSGCSTITLVPDADVIIRQHDFFDLGSAVANSIPYIDLIKKILKL